MLQSGLESESECATVACLRSGVRLEFAPDAMEGAKSIVDSQIWQQ